MNADNPSSETTDLLLSGYNCAQAVLHANCERLHFDHDMALKLATGLGAGVAREGEICGAVTGGVIALGIRFGRGINDDRARTEENYAKTREFLEAFKRRHGSVVCRELLQCDLRTDEGRRHFKENDLLHRTCVKCVETANELVDAAISV
jgi:C_GCAxxG_C_C family probable redox protein